ncbi:MAG TPA: hypothetical protein VEW46_05620 [Pyrinomonadaceae bacterium]|nr:hypothetical protein [Pyrinomonadaceae bacterium]
MNAFALLKADHEKVAGILETIEETTERAIKGRDEQFAFMSGTVASRLPDVARQEQKVTMKYRVTAGKQT